MPTYTPNHDFQVYSQNETPWEHGSDFEKLDTAVEIRDAEANRTGYTPKIGAKFFSSDTGVVYVGNGTAWVKTNLGVAAFTADSVTTGTLTDSTDGQAWETLRELGYDAGDEIVLDSEMYSGSESVSSTTYANAFTGVTEMPLLKTTAFDSLTFSRFELELSSTLHVNNSVDTIYHRLSNFPTCEISHTGDTGYPVKSARVTVTPPLPNAYSSGHARLPTEAMITANTGNIYMTKLSLIGIV